MIVFNKADELHSYLATQAGTGTRIGFIPTMGALHNGHLELIKQSVSQQLLTVCSIFVNPTQFNNTNDFNKYPKTPDADITKLESVGTDILFLPETDEIYPAGTANLEKFNLGYLETILEGSSRPGHFQGVCQVMKRLLTIVDPHLLFMGQKDYQQCLVVGWLLTQMGAGTTLVTTPTVRQADGLAMSSRNSRLSDDGRSKAVAIYNTLLFVKEALMRGSLEQMLREASTKLTDAGFTIDYVSVAQVADLKIVHEWDGETPVLCLIAAFLEDVRLIDNMLLTDKQNTENKLFPLL
jgi:pantoate--beta-alanine ligase